MVYTTAHKKIYDTYFKEGVAPFKMGRYTDQSPNSNWNFPGSLVWKTPEEARKACCEQEDVYGVKVDWDEETTPAHDSKDPGMHYLLKTSDMVQIQKPDKESLTVSNKTF